MATIEDDLLLTTTDAARLAKVSDEGIRRWVRAGWLDCQFTANGMRLFRRSDVLAAAKAKRQRARERGK